MKERKPFFEKITNTSNAVKITVDHNLWYCKETEIKWLQKNITKKIWKGSKEEMEKLQQYVKEIKL
jgi:hypothetical protein